MSKFPKTPRPRKPRTTKKSDGNTSSKIKLRGQHDAPMSMAEIRQGLYDIVRHLEKYPECRAKWATFYLTLVDEDGKEVYVNGNGELILHPYKSLAEELGL